MPRLEFITCDTKGVLVKCINDLCLWAGWSIECVRDEKKHVRCKWCNGKTVPCVKQDGGTPGGKVEFVSPGK
jgi:hypothetical protein